MNFETFVQALCDAEVEFIIIGGWSAILHGSRHSHIDLDIFYSRRTDNLKRLTQALAPYHPQLRDWDRSNKLRQMRYRWKHSDARCVRSTWRA